MQLTPYHRHTTTRPTPQKNQNRKRPHTTGPPPPPQRPVRPPGAHLTARAKTQSNCGGDSLWCWSRCVSPVWRRRSCPCRSSVRACSSRRAPACRWATVSSTWWPAVSGPQVTKTGPHCFATGSSDRVDARARVGLSYWTGASVRGRAGRWRAGVSPVWRHRDVGFIDGYIDTISVVLLSLFNYSLFFFVTIGSRSILEISVLRFVRDYTVEINRDKYLPPVAATQMR